MNKMKHIVADPLPVVRSLVFCGISVDPSKVILNQKLSRQEFARDDVFIHQSIDPYQRIIDANKILASGGSLFLNEKTSDKIKRD